MVPSRLCVLVVAFWGCGDAVEIPIDPVANEEVARVGGVSISRARVEAYAHEHSVGASDALDALVDEALLVFEARRRGIQPDTHETRRLMADALVEAVGASVRPEDISPEDVRISFEAGRVHQERPETRRVSIVTVTGEDRRVVLDAAGLVHDRLEVAPEETLTQARAQPGRGDFTLGVEDLSVVYDETALATAVFGITCTAPCGMPNILMSSDRAEVVWLHEITPAVSLSAEEAEPEVRRQLAHALRAQRLIELIAGLDIEIRANEPAIERLIADGLGVAP